MEVRRSRFLEILEDRQLLSGDLGLGQLQAAAQAVDTLACGTVTVSSSLPSADRADVYSFSPKAAGLFYVNMTAAGGMDPFLSLYNAAGGYLQSNDDAGAGSADSRLSLYVQAGATYYVQAGAAGSAGGDYSLSFTSTPFDDYGNTLASAQRRVLSSSDSGWIFGQVQYAGDVDMFSLTAQQTGRLEIASALAIQGFSLSLAGYDAQGNLIAQGDGSHLTLDVTQGSSYYLSVSGAGGATGAYLLKVQRIQRSSMATATELTAPTSGSQSVSGTLAAGQSMYYKFTTRSSGWFYTDLTSPDGRLDPVLRIYNSQGSLLYTNDDASADTLNSRIRMSVQPGQTYYVRVSGYGRTAGSFQLALTAASADDYGDTIAQARAVALSADGSASVYGQINFDQDVDVFAVTASSTGTMSLSLTPMGSGSTFAPRLRAYSASGGEMGDESTAAGQAVSMQLAVTAGEVYYISAAGVSDGTGFYQVLVSTQQPSDVPTPGVAVTAQVRATAAGSQLFVLGTDGADTITVSQASGVWRVTTSLGVTTFTDAVSGVVVYGFGGSDVLRADYSVNVPTWIYGGAGNDQIFDAGSARGVLSGGEGDDLLVAVGGGADQLTGDDGLDSFWYDAADSVSDASPAESAAKTMHRIAQFYQPYTSTTTSPSYVSLEIAGQNLIDPTLGAYASGYASFASSPLWVDGPEYSDIRQGSLGDCYYLASLAALADTDPEILRQMIAPMGDGTFAMRFYNGAQEIYLRVDADLPVSSGRNLSYARLSPEGESWVALAEKAYAYYRYGENSYPSIEGGWMHTVNAQITGATSTFFWMTSGTAQQMYDFLSSQLAAGHAVTLGSNSNAASPIVGGHAYEVRSAQSSGTSYTVTIYNPWGVDGRSWDSNSGDGLLVVPLNTVYQNFMAAVACQA